MIEALIVGLTIGLIFGFWASRFYSRHEYDGFMHVESDEEHTLYSLVLLDDPATLKDKKTIKFKVKNVE